MIVGSSFALAGGLNEIGRWVGSDWRYILGSSLMQIAQKCSVFKEFLYHVGAIS